MLHFFLLFMHNFQFLDGIIIVKTVHCIITSIYLSKILQNALFRECTVIVLHYFVKCIHCEGIITNFDVCITI